MPTGLGQWISAPPRGPESLASRPLARGNRPERNGSTREPEMFVYNQAIFTLERHMVSRHHPRFTVQDPLTFTGDRKGTGVMTNLSLGGCQLEKANAMVETRTIL